MNRNHIGIVIRRAGRNDAAAIESVLERSFLEFRNLYAPDAYAATVLNEKQILERMDHGPVWIAVENRTVLGTVSLVRRDDGCYIRGMAVLPAERGRGVGRLLLDEVESYAKSWNCFRIYLNTTPFLITAIQLYERSGFRRIDEAHVPVYGTPLFTMEKNLAPGTFDCHLINHTQPECPEIR